MDFYVPIDGSLAIDLLPRGVVVCPSHHEGCGIRHLPPLYALTMTHLLSHLYTQPSHELWEILKALFCS